MKRHKFVFEVHGDNGVTHLRDMLWTMRFRSEKWKGRWLFLVVFFALVQREGEGTMTGSA